jgi:hypothetical protein
MIKSLVKKLFLPLITFILGNHLCAQEISSKQVANHYNYSLEEILVGNWRLCIQRHGNTEITANKCPSVVFLPNKMGYYHTSHDTFIWQEREGIVTFQYLKPQESNKFRELKYYYQVNEWKSFLNIELVSMDSVHWYELSKWNSK